MRRSNDAHPQSLAPFGFSGAVMIPLIPLVVAFFAAFLYSPTSNVFESAGVSHERFLLLTAHPDDEAMFFAPTILGLQGSAPVLRAQPDSPEQVVLSEETASRSHIYSLCLSVGNADGLGSTRREELTQSLNILGVDDDKRWVVDHPYVGVKYGLRSTLNGSAGSFKTI